MSSLKINRLIGGIYLDFNEFRSLLNNRLGNEGFDLDSEGKIAKFFYDLMWMDSKVKYKTEFSIEQIFDFLDKDLVRIESFLVSWMLDYKLHTFELFSSLSHQERINYLCVNHPRLCESLKKYRDDSNILYLAEILKKEVLLIGKEGGKIT